MADIRKRQRPSIKAAEGTIKVTRTAYGDNPAEDSEERITVPIFETDPAHVSVSGGVTINLGDFNSVKMSVMVTLPCLPVDSEIQRAYALASKRVDMFLSEEETRILGDTNAE